MVRQLQPVPDSKAFNTTEGGEERSQDLGSARRSVCILRFEASFVLSDPFPASKACQNILDDS